MHNRRRARFHLPVLVAAAPSTPPPSVPTLRSIGSLPPTAPCDLHCSSASGAPTAMNRVNYFLTHRGTAAEYLRGSLLSPCPPTKWTYVYSPLCQCQVHQARRQFSLILASALRLCTNSIVCRDCYEPRQLLSHPPGDGCRVPVRQLPLTLSAYQVDVRLFTPVPVSRISSQKAI